MTNLAQYHAANLPELFDRITKNSIGMDDYLNRFWDDTTTNNYPPYNLIQVTNTESRLEIALAGFKKMRSKSIQNMVDSLLRETKKIKIKIQTIHIEDLHRDPLIDSGLLLMTLLSKKQTLKMDYFLLHLLR
mgnify:CR=1 FL=1